jgi:pimeloyl-ACP methyl ester carboxylesterase
MDAQLSARLELPEVAPRAYALFAHCITCGKDSVAAARISRALTGYGIAVLRFDFTGLGQPGGDFGNTDFSSNVDDVVYAADHLRAALLAPTILIGHSLDGAAVLAATPRVPEVRAVVTIGAPADPDIPRSASAVRGPATPPPTMTTRRLGRLTLRPLREAGLPVPGTPALRR